MLNFKRVTASSDAVLTGVYSIDRIRLVAGSDAATAVIYDKLTQGTPGDGYDFCKLSANSTFDTDKEDFKGNGRTSIGLSVVLTGTNPVLYIYYS